MTITFAEPAQTQYDLYKKQASEQILKACNYQSVPEQAQQIFNIAVHLLASAHESMNLNDEMLAKQTVLVAEKDKSLMILTAQLKETVDRNTFLETHNKDLADSINTMLSTDKIIAAKQHKFLTMLVKQLAFEMERVEELQEAVEVVDPDFDIQF